MKKKIKTKSRDSVSLTKSRDSVSLTYVHWHWQWWHCFINVLADNTVVVRLKDGFCRVAYYCTCPKYMLLLWRKSSVFSGGQFLLNCCVFFILKLIFVWRHDFCFFFTSAWSSPPPWGRASGAERECRSSWAWPGTCGRWPRGRSLPRCLPSVLSWCCCCCCWCCCPCFQLLLGLLSIFKVGMDWLELKLSLKLKHNGEVKVSLSKCGPNMLSWTVSSIRPPIKTITFQWWI